MKAVILAAGESRRMRPLSATRQKCMLSICGKPLLQHTLEALKAAGLRDIVLVVNYRQEQIRDYFGSSFEGVRIEYAEQRSVTGTGSAFAAAEGFIDDAFLGIAGDVLVDASALKKLLAAHEHGATIAVKKIEKPSQYGVVEIRGSRVMGIKEKAAADGARMINCSVYVFEPGVFAALRGLKRSVRGEYEVTDAINSLAKRGSVRAVEITDWLDVGMPWQLLEAAEYLLGRAKKRCEGAVEDSRITGKAVIEKGAQVIGSRIEGPVYVGAGAVIGPNAYVRGASSIGAGCEIGFCSTVKNSVLLEGVKAKHLAYIGDSVVGANSNFGSGTQVANFRFDGGTVRVNVSGKPADSGRTKLGAMVGDNVKFGVLSCVMPGRKIGENSWVAAGSVVNKDMEPNSKPVRRD